MPADIPRDMTEIADLIAAFDASAAQLQSSHDALRVRVDELTGELARKNEELSRSLAEVSGLKNYLAYILESITDGVLTISPDRTLVAHNQAALDMIPQLVSGEEGMPLRELLPPSFRELGTLLETALESAESRTGVEVVLGEEDERRTLSVSVNPIRDADGDLIGAVQTFRDLTEMKALEDALERRERLAALGEMAAGVAHEIRNPLGGIDLFASKLRREFDPESRGAALCGKISAAASSLNRIVEDMLTFTRNRAPALAPVPLEHVCTLALELAAPALEAKGIAVETEYATGRERIPLDADLLGRAFLNVARNAAEVMEAGGALRVSTRFETRGDERVAVAAFADNGPGIPEEARGKIFNPFFTTRKDGTGLGLAIVHKVVQDHGGAVRVEENRPRGAVFVFELPAGQAAGEPV